MLFFPSIHRLLNRRPPEGDPRDLARARTYPAPYPAGWYHLLDSDELSAQRAQRVECFGESLIVFRDGRDGSPAVLDEFCPHLGASLAGAPVSEGCVQCPFHHWRIGGDGQVRHVPSEPNLRRGARARAFPARDLHGMVLAYHEPGAPRRGERITPRFELEPLADIEEGRLAFLGTYDGGYVRMHLMEFAENSTDFQHFAVLHRDMLVPFLGVRIPFVSVEHRAGWRLDPDRPHVAYFDDRAHLNVLGRDLPSTGAEACIEFWGAGNLVCFRVRLPSLGDIVFFQTHLPLGPMLQRVRFRVFADRGVPRALSLYVVGNWIAHWRRDIAIWENKIHRPQPMLVPSDGPVLEMRRWLRQFYEAAS